MTTNGKFNGRNMVQARRAIRLSASTMALTLAALGGVGSAGAQTAGAAASKPGDNGEIIVTAQRRSERIIDVPYNISAVSGDDLATVGATNANDLTKVVAGLGNFADGPADRFGENNFSLRGLRTDPAGPNQSIKYSVSSVSTYYGDVPVFFSVLLKDIQRVEVLRGPQGTLYGSGAQAGAIRFIPNRPSFDKISGEVNASSGITHSADKPNYSADGVINLPLAENLALRVSAAYVHQAGFVDQVNLFQLDSSGVPVPSVPGDLTSGPMIAPIKKNTNSWTQWMARGALRYKPTDWLDLELAYLHQDTDSNDAQISNPNYQGGVRDLSSGNWPNAPYTTRPGGKYRNTASILQPVNAKLDLITGTAAFDLGFAEFSSISSYYNNRVNSITDLAGIYISPSGNFNGGYNHYPRFNGRGAFAGKEKGFTQELRLVSQGNTPFTYVVGLFYQRQRKIADYDWRTPGLYAFSDVICPASGTDIGLNQALGCQRGANPQLTDKIFGATQTFLNKERAAFGELTYHVTPRWQVTGGIRVFKTTQVFDSFQTYPFFGAIYGDGVAEPIEQGASFNSYSASASKTVYKANTSYDLDPDNKVYFTFAQGYRRGGANPLATTGPTASLPEFQQFKPDIANNYEVGIKGRTLGRRLTYSLSAFLIDLKDFQFYGFTPAGYTAIFNGEKARSKGIELEASFMVTPELTLSGNYTYTKTSIPTTTVIRDLAGTALTRPSDPGFQPSDIVDNPGATVLKGSVLPGVSRHAATAAVDYEIPSGGDSKVILHANANYRSKQNNVIASASENFAVIPSVFTADARVTYDSGQGWSGSLFVTNLTNAFNSTGTLGTQNQNTSVPQALISAGKIVGTPRTFGASLNYDF